VRHDDSWALVSPTWGPVIRRYAPVLVLERDRYGDEAEAPVDFDACREPRCADVRTARPVAFVHLRRGPRADYIGYWLYYPDSRTAHGPLRALDGFHRDDWEGVVIRLDAGGAWIRATAHEGFAGAGPWWSRASGWRRAGPHPVVFRAAGSHAGGFGRLDLDLAGDDWNGTLATVARLALEPADAARSRRRRFDAAAPPPWLKRAWVDPEVPSTSADGRRGPLAEAALIWAAAHGLVD
jgi:hypothetical protein